MVGGVLFGLAGCATPPKNDPAALEAYKQANDPLEPFNRNMLKVNLVLDDAILKPVAYVYKETLPKFAQDSVDAFLHNLRTPVILANDLMQGSGDRAWTTFVRFLANSTVGIGGLIDVAADWGYPSHDEDFGQTLAVWGVDSGPYLMLPLFGPSNPRDAVGRAVDSVIDPISWLAPNSWQLGQFAAEAVDDRAMNYDAIEDLKKTSLDFYAAVRSLYRQRRADEIRNGKPTASGSGSPSPVSSEPQSPESPAVGEQPTPSAPETSMVISPALDGLPATHETAEAAPAPASESTAAPAPRPERAAAVAMPSPDVTSAPAPAKAAALAPMPVETATPAPMPAVAKSPTPTPLPAVAKRADEAASAAALRAVAAPTASAVPGVALAATPAPAKPVKVAAKSTPAPDASQDLHAPPADDFYAAARALSQP